MRLSEAREKVKAILKTGFRPNPIQKQLFNEIKLGGRFRRAGLSNNFALWLESIYKRNVNL